MKAISTKLLSLFITIILLVSCESKVSLESLEEKTPVSFVQNTERLDVSKAQSWFEQKIDLPNKTARTSANKPIKKANWDVAMQMFSTKRGQYLQIPISYDNVKSLTYSEKKNGKTTSLPLPTEMLYIYNDKGKYDYYVVELLPDEEYLKKLEKKSDKVKLFNKRQYSGYFFVKDWNDAPKEGWYMKNGKVVRQLSVAESKKNGKQMACEWWTRLHFSIACVTAGSGGGEIVAYGTSIMIPGNEPDAGMAIAGILSKPDGYNCANDEWQCIATDVFIDCSFDGSISDPIEDFPFLLIPEGPTVGAPIYGTLQLLAILELNFNLNNAERIFYSEFPWVIPQAMINRANATDVAVEKYCTDHDDFNGNAFKHAYWSALNTWSFGSTVARTMGLLHESENFGSYISREMDLYNNELGITIASQLPWWEGEEVLKASILNAIQQGQGKRASLVNDGSGHQNFLIPTDASNICN
jgi:hypothetical protein